MNDAHRTSRGVHPCDTSALEQLLALRLHLARRRRDLLLEQRTAGARRTRESRPGHGDSMVRSLP